MNKIFQIGFNKCGTSSIYELFNKYTSLKCLHWDYGKIAYTIKENHKNNRWLLTGYEHIDVFTDMECRIVRNNMYELVYGYKYFDILDKQYPDSKFILNTRNIDNWIDSRLKHTSGYIIDDTDQKLIKKLNPEISYYKRYSLNIDEVINIWRQQWHEHHDNVLNYFHKKQNQLLIYDIEINDISKIIEFFQPHGITFNTNSLPHANKTKDSA